MAELSNIAYKSGNGHFIKGKFGLNVQEKVSNKRSITLYRNSREFL